MTSGQPAFNNESPPPCGPARRCVRDAAQRLRRPGVSPADAAADNVALGFEAQGILKSQRRRVDAALDLVDRDAYRRQLSGGMAQRLALRRALVNDPKVLVLDEQLRKLDSLTRITMQAELVALRLRTLFLANRVIVLSDRPARIKADIVVPRPYLRHRGDPYLAERRRRILSLSGLDATW